MTTSRRGISFDEASLEAGQRKAKAWGMTLSAFVRHLIDHASETQGGEPAKPDRTKDIVDRLRDACNGHPYAVVPWPHYLLHDAANEIERLRGEKPPASEEK